MSSDQKQLAYFALGVFVGMYVVPRVRARIGR
jgi:hypothetical protein